MFIVVVTDIDDCSSITGKTNQYENVMRLVYTKAQFMLDCLLNFQYLTVTDAVAFMYDQANVVL